MIPFLYLDHQPSKPTSTAIATLYLDLLSVANILIHIEFTNVKSTNQSWTNFFHKLHFLKPKPTINLS